MKNTLTTNERKVLKLVKDKMPVALLNIWSDEAILRFARPLLKIKEKKR